ncbi:AAA family ATPase [Promicromonospora soli]
MTTTAPLSWLRPAPGSPGDTPDPLMIVVGGVPGAGKSTLLARIADDAPGSVVLDPDRYRRGFARRLPSWVPYAAYRWAVHTLHAAVTLLYLLRGPRSGAPVLVHDTATRERRRETLGLLARSRGWDPVLVAVDVSLHDALDGQLDRGRVVRPEEFVRHWERWTAQRSALAALDGGPSGPWSGVYLTARCDALRQVRELALRRTVVRAPRVTGVARVTASRARAPRA